MSKILYITAASGVFFVVWGVAFLRQDPPRLEPLPPTLQDRWNDSMRDIPLPGPSIQKEDKIIPEEPKVISVTPIKIIPDEKELPKKKQTETKRNYSDVCQKHGRRKVYISKTRWRCRK